MKMWTVRIRDQTALSVKSDLDLHYPQKLLMSSSDEKVLQYSRKHCGKRRNCSL